VSAGGRTTPRRTTPKGTQPARHRARWCTKRRDVLQRAAHDPTLISTDVRVLGALASYSDDSAKPCWPSQERLAKQLGFSTRTVSRSVGRLEAAGYLAVLRAKPERDRPSGRFRRRHTNRYCLCRPPGRPAEYRPGQHRVYRVAALRALQREAEQANAGQNSCPDLHDTGDASTPCRGEPNPAPAPPAVDSSSTSPPTPTLAAPGPSSTTPPGSTNTPAPHGGAPVCGPPGGFQELRKALAKATRHR
jgi:DNA-binding transcriptional MocR family regulator